MNYNEICLVALVSCLIQSLFFGVLMQTIALRNWLGTFSVCIIITTAVCNIVVGFSAIYGSSTRDLFMLVALVTALSIFGVLAAGIGWMLTYSCLNRGPKPYVPTHYVNSDTSSLLEA
jgi:hypothetical protein